jgi:hypothetical protein
VAISTNITWNVTAFFTNDICRSTTQWSLQNLSKHCWTLLNAAETLHVPCVVKYNEVRRRLFRMMVYSWLTYMYVYSTMSLNSTFLWQHILYLGNTILTIPSWLHNSNTRYLEISTGNLKTRLLRWLQHPHLI